MCCTFFDHLRSSCCFQLEHLSWRFIHLYADHHFRTCFGLILTSYNRHDADNPFKEKLSLAIDTYTYNLHKKRFTIQDKILPSYFDFDYLNYELKLKLGYVKIYFDATSFDQITKDRSDSAMDKLSAIGGTMGLHTGFSIISGVEIVYFGVKIILSLISRRKHYNPRK